MIHDFSNADLLKMYFKQINTIPRIAPREFDYLYKRIKKGDENAKTRLVEGNLRLVVSIAMRYQNMGLSLMDLIEEGNLGLIRAIRRYEQKKGPQFSTYASWWIRQTIRRALDNYGKTIRIPSYATENIRKWIHAWEALRTKLGRNPSIREAAENLDLTVKEVKNVIHAAEMSRDTSSLDDIVTEDENIAVSDVLADQTISGSPEDMLEQSRKQDTINDVVGVLSDREQHVVMHRFGLDGGKGRTLAEIGDELHISRERVRQIIEVALSKMRKALQRKNIDE